ncbi:MAG TPA: LptE family protein [Granulicella sp.]|jgi:outer membrane lipopolysaccharide assembly protein LptE/RlpB|nr:LptE family protein [Granulicella sp.]
MMTPFSTTLRRLLTATLLSAPLALAGCGYHAVGAASHIPGGVRTIDVPIFATHVLNYNTETVFTQAVIRELNSRTSYRILNGENADADAHLTGTILTQSITPLTYDSTSGQTASYLVTITAKVVLTARDGRILYQNDALPFRDQYQSTQDLNGFIQEDSPAVRRIAQDFAHTIVENMLESL